MKGKEFGEHPEYWWRTFYFTDFAARERKPRHVLDVETESGMERTAWAYELVRHAHKEPGLAPFPQLTISQRIELRQALEEATGYAPLTESMPFPRLGFSSPFPHIQFNLNVDNTQPMGVFRAWLEEERTRLGIRKPKGKKGKSSRNRLGLSKTIDWRMIELLDHQKGRQPPLSDTERTKLTRARKMARTLKEVIERGFSTSEQATREMRDLVEAQMALDPETAQYVGKLDDPMFSKLLEAMFQKIFGERFGPLPPPDPDAEAIKQLFQSLPPPLRAIIQKVSQTE